MMEKQQIKKLLKILDSNLDREKTEDIIGEIFEQRSENIHFELRKNQKYMKNEKKATKIEKEIEQKFEDKTEIIHLLSEYEDAIDENSKEYGAIMYKYGISDAFNIILEGTSKIKID